MGENGRKVVGGELRLRDVSSTEKPSVPTSVFMEDSYVYVLQLEGDKYYVGRSNVPHNRILQHDDGKGSEWTKLHKPKSVLAIYPHCDGFDEDMHVKRAMLKYKIENVRGGAYCQPELSLPTMTYLDREILAATDRCYECRKTGHFARECPTRATPLPPRQETTPVPMPTSIPLPHPDAPVVSPPSSTSSSIPATSLTQPAKVVKAKKPFLIKTTMVEKNGKTEEMLEVPYSNGTYPFVSKFHRLGGESDKTNKCWFFTMDKKEALEALQTNGV